jgi:hypothetical protein
MAVFLCTKIYNMKRKLFALLTALFAANLNAQNPGLVISEILANPNGNDLCKEYVELVATQNINFSVTPYSVIVCNNGSATNLGWINGGSITYGFCITTGSVAAGDVVYVGGSCMAPTGTQIRVIDVTTTAGDGGIGNIAPTAGVFGNGGTNADGVAVFNLPINAITPSTVPTDAIFFGTGVGSASVTGGVDGYQLPVNDFYAGGKLGSSSYFGPDSGADILITATGIFNTSTNTWSVSRSIGTGITMTSGVSTVSLTNTGVVAPAGVSFVTNDTTVSESTSQATIYLKITSASTASSSVSVYATALSNASAVDYTLANTTFTFPANAPVNSTAAITFSINNDAIPESAEYIVLRFYNPQNVTIGSTYQYNFYIADNDKVIPQASNSLSLALLSSFSNTVSGSNSAEIVAHDPISQRLFIANSIGAKLDIVDFVNPSNPTLISSIPISSYGNINSVAVKNGIVATAIENGTNPQDSGKVVFFNTNGVFLSQVKVGMMPDMITFNHAGTRVITANEGEPNTTYTLDPDGSVSIIDISGGVQNVTQSNVSHVTFTVYNGQETALRAQGIRIFGLGANAAKDFEPEYVTVSPDDSKCWVSLQENNALMEINLVTNTITSLRALGTKNYSLLNNGFDASNVTKGINISNFPVKGFYMPDAIASYTVAGVPYVISANEGDSRAYNAFSEEKRVAQLTLDPVKFPNGNELKNNYTLGRLTVTDKNGDIDNDGDIDTIYAFGSRSFSIWNANTGNLVYDSKDDLEQITASNSFSVLFNASNTANTKKDRSDDKGPEPEGVTLGTIGTNIYAFIALERIGGVMVYDVTNPAAPVYVTYVNNRSFATNGPDRGAEGVIFIHQSDSPNGMHIVVAANEVSSTLSVWGIAGCPAPLSSSLSVTGSTSNVCSNNAAVLSVPFSSTLTYQWSNNGTPIPGAVSNTVMASVAGNYSVSITGGTNCATTSKTQSISVNPSPTVSVAGATAVCIGSSLTQTLTGAATYSLNGASTPSVLSLSPSGSTNYIIIGAYPSGCTGTLTSSVSVNPLPVINIAASPTAVCAGQSSTLTASGATTYSWSTTSPATVITVTPTQNTTYTVSGIDANGCSAVTSKTIPVNALPTVSVVSSKSVICIGEIVSISATGASTYSWSTGGQNASISVSPGATTVYVVTGTSSMNCSATAQITQTVSQCTVLNELSRTGSFNLYPNPATSQVTVIFENEEITTLRVINSLGAIVLEEKNYASGMPVDISELAKGIYFVQISATNNQMLKKLIVE